MFGTLLAIALAGQTAQAVPAPLRFDCRGPILPDMPAQAILARFGRDARRGDVTGVAGKAVKGVILYPDDPARRLEIVFWDDAQTVVQSVTAEANSTAWTGPRGLHVGSTLKDAMAANGRNFGLSGFDWNYGGYIVDSWGGNLGKLDGGCAIQVRFALPSGIKPPTAIEGEHALAATMPMLQTIKPHIDRLSTSWPLRAGVKAAGT